MDAVERFAILARGYAHWLLEGTDTDADAARACLIHLLDLYRAALELPPPWSDEPDTDAGVERVSRAEWEKALDTAARRLPLGTYRKVFNPVEAGDDDAVTGLLQDDVADIYRDLVTGLRALEEGRRAEAVWEWSFDFQFHWGAHATSAIHALHWWLAENAGDRLSVKQ